MLGDPYFNIRFIQKCAYFDWHNSAAFGINLLDIFSLKSGAAYFSIHWTTREESWATIIFNIMSSISNIVYIFSTNMCLWVALRLQWQWKYQCLYVTVSVGIWGGILTISALHTFASLSGRCHRIRGGVCVPIWAAFYPAWTDSNPFLCVPFFGYQRGLAGWDLDLFLQLPEDYQLQPYSLYLGQIDKWEMCLCFGFSGNTCRAIRYIERYRYRWKAQVQCGNMKKKYLAAVFNYRWTDCKFDDIVKNIFS